MAIRHIGHKVASRQSRFCRNGRESFMTYAAFRRNLMISLALLACHAKADIVTFESTPTGAAPVDDSILSTPYNITGGSVRFFFDTNGNNKYDAGTDVNPLFEQAGNDGANGF